MIAVRRGRVDIAQEHFEVVCREDEESDELIPAILVGSSSEGVIKIERQTDPRLTSEMKDRAAHQVHFFLVQMPRDWGGGTVEELWDYMRYHARHTAANHYGTEHWILKNFQGEEVDAE